MKCCKVIITCFENKPEGNSALEELAIFQYHFNKEQTIDPGVDMDLIVINHPSVDRGSIGEAALIYLNGARIKRGIVKTHFLPKKEKEGYSQTFDLYKDEYDYWAFFQSNVIIIAPNTYREAINLMEEDKEIDFVTVVPPSKTTRDILGRWTHKSRLTSPLNLRLKKELKLVNIPGVSLFPINVEKHELLSRCKKEMGGEKADNHRYIYQIGL